MNKDSKSGIHHCNIAVKLKEQMMVRVRGQGLRYDVIEQARDGGQHFAHIHTNSAQYNTREYNIHQKRIESKPRQKESTER